MSSHDRGDYIAILVAASGTVLHQHPGPFESVSQWVQTTLARHGGIAHIARVTHTAVSQVTLHEAV